MNTDTVVNLFELDAPRLAAFFERHGERPYRAAQLIHWVHQRGVIDFDQMTNISKALRGRIATAVEVRLPQVVADQTSQDGTRKWLLRLDAGNAIETVFIPENARGTLCISSQVGCALDCRFCATARQGFNRNLSVGEIIAQVWIAARALGQRSHDTRRITNVVFMGMGEPLLNLPNVVDAARLIMDAQAYGLARKRVTVSTAGVVPGIDALRAQCPVSLAVSLHAPNDELRNELVPINRKYPLAALLAACRRYAAANPHAQITFEYVMLAGVNDDPALARDLARLLAGLPAKINLIPFNGFDGARFRASDSAAVDRFRDELIRRQILTITRKTRGDDIAAACGQLVGQVLAKGARARAAVAPLENHDETIACAS